jgi:hypothetical protein
MSDAPQTGAIQVISEYSQLGMPNQAMYAFVVKIDGRTAGEVLPEQSEAFITSPGVHEVRVGLAWFRSRPVSVTVPRGGRVVLKTDMYRKFRFLRALATPLSALRLEVVSPDSKWT